MRGEMEETSRSRGKRVLEREGIDRRAMRKKLLLQQEENDGIRSSTKELFLQLVEDIAETVRRLCRESELQKHLEFRKDIPRSELVLSSRRTVLQGVVAPQNYCRCDCCGEGYARRRSVRNREPSFKRDDATILYDVFKMTGKTTTVAELKEGFSAAFDQSSETEEVINARFWDCLTTFQYVGFLSIDEKNDKITKLDFALSSVCNKHSTQSHAGSYSRG